MITVADRVLHAIDGCERGEFEFALEDVAVAIDMTSKRFAGADRSGESGYKAFLDTYFWLIELMAPNVAEVQASLYQHPTIPDVSTPHLRDAIGYFVHCGLVHSTGLPADLRFNAGRQADLSKDLAQIPAQLLWGLLATVVFSNVNANERSSGGYYLTCEGVYFRIADSWGREDLVRSVYEQQAKVRVPLEAPPAT
jgi:hypothetical protein